MIMFKNAKYMKNDLTDEIISIFVEIDGVTIFVPLDPMNGDYQQIMKLVAEGKLVIAPADEQS